MNELMKYIQIIKDIAMHYYEKEVLFYDNESGWHSREYGRYISIDELEEFIKEITKPNDHEFYDDSSDTIPCGCCSCCGCSCGEEE